jgi:hypothetical protein
MTVAEWSPRYEAPPASTSHSWGLQRRRLSFRLDGQNLHAGRPLTRVRGGENESWLLVETSDEYAGARRNPVRSQPESVLSGCTLDELG